MEISRKLGGKDPIRLSFAARAEEFCPYFLPHRQIAKDLSRGIGRTQSKSNTRLGEWIEKREELFPNDPIHCVPWFIGVFQDTFTFFVAGYAIANELLQCFNDVCKKYSIKLSEGDGTMKPFSQLFETMHVTYDTRVLRKIERKPIDAKINKLRAVLGSIVDFPNKEADRADFEMAAVRTMVLAQFMPCGEVFCNMLYLDMENTAYLRHDKAFVSHNTVADN